MSSVSLSTLIDVTSKKIHAVESFLAGVEVGGNSNASSYVNKMRGYCYDIRNGYLKSIEDIINSEDLPKSQGENQNPTPNTTN